MAKSSAGTGKASQKPSKSSKSAPIAKSAAKKQLSAEFIVDSSDDDEAPERPVQAKSPPKAKLTPKSSLKSVNKALTPKPTKQKPVKPASSSEEDSSEEEAKAAETDSSEAEEQSENEVTTEMPNKTPAGKGKTVRFSSPAASESDSSSGSAAASDNSSEEPDAPATPILSKSKARARPPKAKSQPQPESESSPEPEIDEGPRPARSFRPPHNFEALGDLEDFSDMLQLSKTEGKQVWYITVPASIPLTSLTKVDLQKYAKGEPVMKYEDKHYGFISEAGLKATTSISMPKEDGYSIVSTRIDDVLHLRQLVQLPTATESQVGRPASSSTVLPESAAATKPKREQPRGLRIQYRPSGAPLGDLGVIGSSDEDEPLTPRPQFRAPLPLNGVSPTKKRKERDEEAINETIEKLHKKTKKKNQESQVQVEAPAPTNSENTSSESHKLKEAQEMLVNGSGENVPKKKKKHRESVDEVSTTITAIDEEIEPSSNKKRREGEPDSVDSIAEKEHKKKKKHREPELEGKVPAQREAFIAPRVEAGIDVSLKKSKKDKKESEARTNGVHIEEVDEATEKAKRKAEKKKRKEAKERKKQLKST